MRLPALIATCLLVGCKAKDEPRWAVQHASVVAGVDSVSGYQVWEFYSKRWKKKHAEKYHLCARVQVLDGVAVDPMEGCADCAATYAVRTEELETDCAGAVADGAGYAAVSHFALGPVPSELADDAPYGDDTLGWYLSMDGVAVEPMGFAWSESLDAGDAAEDWVEGARFVLYPAYAWELGE